MQPLYRTWPLASSRCTFWLITAPAPALEQLQLRQHRYRLPIPCSQALLRWTLRLRLQRSGRLLRRCQALNQALLVGLGVTLVVGSGMATAAATEVAAATMLPIMTIVTMRLRTAKVTATVVTRMVRMDKTRHPAMSERAQFGLVAQTTMLTTQPLVRLLPAPAQSLVPAEGEPAREARGTQGLHGGDAPATARPRQTRALSWRCRWHWKPALSLQRRAQRRQLTGTAQAQAHLAIPVGPWIELPWHSTHLR